MFCLFKGSIYHESKLCFHSIPMDQNLPLWEECKHNQSWEWFPHLDSTLAWDTTLLCLLGPLSLRSWFAVCIFMLLIEYFIENMSFEYVTFPARRLALVHKVSCVINLDLQQLQWILMKKNIFKKRVKNVRRNHHFSTIYFSTVFDQI